VAVFEALGDVAELLGDHEAAIDAYARAIALSGADVVSRARLSIRCGRSQDHMQRRGEARESFREALRALGAPDGSLPGDPEWRGGVRGSPPPMTGLDPACRVRRRLLATALQNLGWSHYAAGELAEAEATYSRGLAVCKGLDLPLARAALQNGIGALCRARGYIAGAVAAHRMALELRREAGDRAGEATSMLNLGNALSDQGAYDEACEYFRGALSIHEATGNTEGTALASLSLGTASRYVGDLSVADEAIGRAVSIARGTEAWYLARCLEQQAEVALDAGDCHRAEALLDEALVLEPADAPTRAQLEIMRAESLMKRGEYQDSASILATALPKLESTVRGAAFGHACQRAGRIQRALGDREAAARTLRQSGEVWARLGNTTLRDRVERDLLELAESNRDPL